MSSNGCCVPGCPNKNKRDQPHVSFYSFPSHAYEIERKRKWIEAIKHPDGTQWIPGRYSRICSEHFVGGQKSTIESHPAYIPSIFPFRKNPSMKTQKARLERHKRAMERFFQSRETPILPCREPKPRPQPPPEPAQKHVCTQVSSTYDCPAFHFSSIRVDEMTVGTQCFIALPTETPTKVDKSSGSTDELRQGFLGYESLTENSQLTNLSGVTPDVFKFLLSLMPTKSQRSLKNENCLLLFLMRMKMGIPMLTLAALFNVHRSTVSRIFIAVLDLLANKTKDLVVWLDKASIHNALPRAVKKNFPNARAVITCNEIKAEIPAQLEERICMFSSTKKTHAFKYFMAVTPEGLITFKTETHCGCTDDTFIANSSGFFNLLENGDQLLTVKDLPGLNANSNTVILVPPLVNEGKFTPGQIADRETLASVRVHVERAIARLEMFKIFELVSLDMYPLVDKLLHVACVIANFTLQNSRKKKDENCTADSEVSKAVESISNNNY